MDIYLYFVILLFALAAVDLVVGVSNDAANFLNSAIGSRVAPYRTILLVAGVGILLGSVFSDGMMEIARNGIFEPSFFSLDQVMYIFMAVMLTDVILLDFYNSQGLPTSTTVSLIFELLGASFAVGMMVILSSGKEAVPVSEYINYSSALTIIAGIFLSVFLSFFVGSFVQYLARIMFSFRISRTIKRWGAIFAGISITTIVYFLLIKGAKGSAIISKTQSDWIAANTWMLMGSCLVGFTILTWILMKGFKVNPLKIIVLLGTFSLAMAFAGNDLVNFLGVSIAGLNSFQAYVAASRPDSMNMGVLNEAVRTPFWLLLSAGVVMVVTLWTNAKSKKVTETEVSLGNQDEVNEKFAPNALSRMLVGGSIVVGKIFSTLMPESYKTAVAKRFKRGKKVRKKEDSPSFDLVRASINLVTASALIAFGTANKLPLSTTFVTFMVSMGSSFADQAWGRESAVYRVAGVLRVIGGWLLTALLAFIGCGIVATILFATGKYGVTGMAAIAAFVLIRSHIRFKKNEEKERLKTPIFNYSASAGAIVREHRKEIMTSFSNVDDILKACIESLRESRVKPLKEVKERLAEMIGENSKLNDRIIKYISKLDGAPSSVAKNYLLVFDRMQNIHQSCLLINEVCVTHVSNHHALPDQKFHEALRVLRSDFHSFVQLTNESLKAEERDRAGMIEQARNELKSRIEVLLENQIYQLTKGKLGNKLGLLQIRILLEVNDIITEMTEISRMFLFFHEPKAAQA